MASLCTTPTPTHISPGFPNESSLLNALPKICLCVDEDTDGTLPLREPVLATKPDVEEIAVKMTASLVADIMVVECRVA